MDTKNSIERRMFKRFKVKGPAYAAVGHGFEVMGHIINISRSGIAFSYVHDNDALPVMGETRIQISDSQSVICDMPFISISDRGGDLADPHSSVAIRHHRGCFGVLTREQLNSLIDFLEEKTPFELIKN